MSKGWIGIDLDGTLAKYDEWRGVDHVGEPIAPVVAKVKQALEMGYEVKVFTARVSTAHGRSLSEVMKARDAIAEWTKQHVGQVLTATCQKDFLCLEIWDDRAVGVGFNTGVFDKPTVVD